MGKKIKRVVEGLEVTDINSKGMGVAKDASKAVYFIKNTIPGDLVDVLVYKKRRGYFEAEPTAFIKESPHRVTPPCSHFGLCGGCKWQH
ncbi:MAG: TRAM domain-containing protein, partial [Flavobacteriaceae bacterium]